MKSGEPSRRLHRHQQVLAEALATALLVATVIGSGVMAESLASGDMAVALLANTLSTAAMLAVLILVFGPISGAHMNPAVSAAFLLRREISPRVFVSYVVAQFGGAVAGVVLAHAMFDLPVLQISTHVRSSAGQWLSEGVATFGLVLTVMSVRRTRPAAIPYAVGLYIAAAYWFTASTSFANPAVTAARSLSESFAGISPASIPAFVCSQLLGAIAATAVLAVLVHDRADKDTRRPKNAAEVRRSGETG